MTDRTFGLIYGIAIGLIIGSGIATILVSEKLHSDYAKRLADRQQAAQLKLVQEVETASRIACVHGVIDAVKYINSWSNKEPNCEQVGKQLSEAYK